ncbi:alanyl-tRNA synthetase [Crocosphaera subtropica ATCC 51142]|uniref:Alanine--tRNA ligase n=1 Tax=Crocosphaera subtropica (strain ATCC 51142 / BH68) TaxID=43989 RepID=SYA_CROS5|nr:alanine--tRNA ligase [Crocosphaera subtropica]B1WYQ5.1 RecName: Full=Alanine--tRNA ligase; AltName: Full=Alanyl-tRNA synthetase; Short=AlaRS [Crocosphaera subtropica ATCC 51142]ACB51072.1 alanyl-tRNA synthetase [Crocosphaera subtropica ATCC 51142]
MTTTAPFLTGNQIRDRFLQFYAQHNHQILPSASLVPEDPTVLLTIAGMLPFKPIFLGQKQPDFPRATTSQKCIRTNDIENVGRTARHHTFFEMLGNFSFGDYFKEQAIKWAWELSTKVYRLPPENIVVSVFEKDDEAFKLWEEMIGIPPQRIKRMGEKDNFWKAGPTGPCGPCSELYYDFHPELGEDNIDLEDDSRFIEFYNLVFMEYNRDAEGNLAPLQNKNIDTGMGLERMAQILQKVPNNYETDLIFPIIETAANIANIDYQKATEKTKVSLKVIGDHVRSVVHMIADGITASNTDRGYVLRRLIRRVVRHGRLIGIEGQFIKQVAETAIELSENAYPQVRERESFIKGELEREETAFLKTLERGEKLLAEIIEKTETQGQISGVDAFTLYDTYGFPLELTQEIAEESNLTVNIEEFEAEMRQQQERSKAAHETIDLTVQGSLDKLAEHIHPTAFLGYTDLQLTAKVEAVLIQGKTVDTAEAGSEVQIVLDQTPFYGESGGQIGDRGFLTGENLVIRVEDVQKESGIFVHFGRVERGSVSVNDQVTATIDRACRRQVQANHTATHLLQAALKKVVDKSISQAGSLVAFDRLRFDFNCPRAVTSEELQEIEDLINTWIAEAHETEIAVMPIETAKEKGAIAMFGEKYGSEVRVIDVPGVSMELCGGTHVKNTAEIGLFKIMSESGISSGVRRIEAVAGPAVLEYLKVRETVVKDLCDRFKIKPEEISDRITTLQSELKTTQKELEAVKQDLAVAKSDQLLTEAESIGEFKLLVSDMGEMDAKALQTAAERLQQKLGEGAVILGSIPSEGKVSLVAAFSKKVNQEKQLQAGKFIGQIAKICGGGGGGRPNLAQAGGREPSKLSEALLTAKEQLTESLK